LPKAQDTGIGKCRRAERASLILTSDLPFSGWGTVFGDQAVAAAMIDRTVQHADVLTLKAPATGSAGPLGVRQLQARHLRLDHGLRAMEADDIAEFYEILLRNQPRRAGDASRRWCITPSPRLTSCETSASSAA
jgi:hypothetical protein